MHNEQLQQLQLLLARFYQEETDGACGKYARAENTHRILVKKLEGKTLLGTRWHTQKDNIEIYEYVKRDVTRGRQMDLSGSV